MKNITNIEKSLCTGCGACYNKCPFNAITMELDGEGFIAPQINDDKCMDCGLCYKVCPVEKPVEKNKKPDAYAVWAEDEIRLKSSSGGMFTLLADAIFERDGVVCGARYSDDYMSVYHTWATNMDELAPLRGSKYVQSDVGKTYKEAKGFLDEGKTVLYTGCPCQIAGLYNYLGKEYDNLYTADLVCHGQNSITAYRSFINEYSGGKPFEKISFRDKEHFGWSTSTVMYFKDGTVKKSPWNDNKWNEGFLDGIINRESCYSCPYANDQRVADVTLADCWQVHRINPEYDDRKGTSLVLVNSKKGEKIFKLAKKKMKLCELVPLEELKKYNGQLNKPAPKHPSREFFFSHLHKGYHSALWYGKGRRFDTGIVGWWFASNYGSSLTYYALASILISMGKQPIFVRIPKLDNTPWDKDAEQTIEFIGKRFRIANYRDIGHMKELNVFCDSFLVGSDQMWTPLATNLVGYTFFLDFADLNKKKIAFSTSFGQDTFEADEKICATAKDYLNRFDAISVREYSGVDICKNKFGIDAQQIIDPVFLCPEEKYNEIVSRADFKLPKKYLLSYILDPTPEKEEAVEKIAKEEKLEIISIMSMRDYDKNAENWHIGEIVPKPTTEEFLYYIKNCSYLVTDSHHGACMGIIYKRPYAAITNASRGVTRFETVAKAFGLEDRVLYNPLDALENNEIHKPIDYDKVFTAIEREKQKALKWLTDAFEMETKISEETVNTLSAKNYALERCIENTIRWCEYRLKQK